MRLAITHTSVYNYSKPARSNQNELRLSPVDDAFQAPGPLEIVVDPAAELRTWRDAFGNLVHWFEIEPRHFRLTVVSRSEVETRSRQPLIDAAFETPLEPAGRALEQRLPELHDFLGDSLFVARHPDIWKEALDLVADSEGSFGSVLSALSSHVFSSCRYDPAFVPKKGTALEIFEKRRGICQDFSHLMLAYCRALHIPARYVSGYLFDEEADPEAPPTGAAAALSHAWIEAYVAGSGWTGIDPTNDRWIDEHYVAMACGRDYYDAAPIRGTLVGGGPHRTLQVHVRVARAE